MFLFVQHHAQRIRALALYVDFGVRDLRQLKALFFVNLLLSSIKQCGLLSLYSNLF